MLGTAVLATTGSSVGVDVRSTPASDLDMAYGSCSVFCVGGATSVFAARMIVGAGAGVVTTAGKVGPGGVSEDLVPRSSILRAMSAASSDDADAGAGVEGSGAATSFVG